jgi:hypothetical protein
MQILAGTATARQMLQSGANATPAWSTATWPATTTINRILFSSANNTVSEITAANNGVLVSGATGVPSMLAGPGTSGNMLQSNAAAAPSYSDATYPTTIVPNEILYSSSSDTVTGLATVNQAALTTSATGVPTYAQMDGDGELLIGSTAGAPVAATLTAGSGISITNGSNSITIAASGSGLATVNVTGTSQQMAVETQYIADNASLVTLTLPATAALGDTIRILGFGTGGWLVAQNAGQRIHIGTGTSTTGVTGSIASTHDNDNLTLICVTANTTFTALAPQGNITFA